MPAPDQDKSAKSKTNMIGAEMSHDKHSILPEVNHAKRDNHRQPRVSWPAFVMIQFLILLGIVMFYKSSVAPKINQEEEVSSEEEDVSSKEEEVSSEEEYKLNDNTI